MGILSGIFKARDKPENRTAGSAYTFYMGGSTSGKNVTERSAMQMTAVYSCVRILAEAGFIRNGAGTIIMAIPKLRGNFAMTLHSTLESIIRIW